MSGALTVGIAIGLVGAILAIALLLLGSHLWLSWKARLSVTAATPEESGEHEPQVVPAAFRDPAFVADPVLVQRRVAEASLNRLRGRHGLDLVESDEPAKGPGGVPVTERTFTLTTHCPAGHIGDHWLSGFECLDSVDVVRRTCRHEPCGEQWLEPA